jgi:hypothetical protein
MGITKGLGGIDSAGGSGGLKWPRGRNRAPENSAPMLSRQKSSKTGPNLLSLRMLRKSIGNDKRRASSQFEF